jgi:hypothetical protein
MANLALQLSSSRICLLINLICDSANRGLTKWYLLVLRLSPLLPLLLGLFLLLYRLLLDYHLLSVCLLQMLLALQPILRLLRPSPFHLRLRFSIHLHLRHGNKLGSLFN